MTIITSSIWIWLQIWRLNKASFRIRGQCDVGKPAGLCVRQQENFGAKKLNKRKQKHCNIGIWKCAT